MDRGTTTPPFPCPTEPRSADVDAALLDRLEQLSRPALKAPEAARYIGTSLSSFKKMAPSLPRCRLGDNSYVYLKRDLLDYLERVREAP